MITVSTPAACMSVGPSSTGSPATLVNAGETTPEQILWETREPGRRWESAVGNQPTASGRRVTAASLAEDAGAPAHIQQAARKYLAYKQYSDVVSALAADPRYEGNALLGARRWIAAGIDTPARLALWFDRSERGVIYHGPKPDPGHPVRQLDAWWDGAELLEIALRDEDAAMRAPFSDAYRDVATMRMHNGCIAALHAPAGFPVDTGERWYVAGVQTPDEAFLWAHWVGLGPSDAAHFIRAGYFPEAMAEWAAEHLPARAWYEGPAWLPANHVGRHPAGQLARLHNFGLIHIPTGSYERLPSFQEVWGYGWREAAVPGGGSG